MSRNSCPTWSRGTCLIDPGSYFFSILGRLMYHLRTHTVARPYRYRCLRQGNGRWKKCTSSVCLGSSRSDVSSYLIWCCFSLLRCSFFFCMDSGHTPMSAYATLNARSRKNILVWDHARITNRCLGTHRSKRATNTKHPNQKPADTPRAKKKATAYASRLW